MTHRVCIIRHREYELPLRREAEALRRKGYEVDVICLREAGHAFREELNGVRCFRVPLTRERGGAVRYLFDYGAFFLAAALLVTVLHLRHRYAAVQANTMPDLLAFAGLVPRLLGAKAVVFMKEPSPELAEMMFGPGLVVRVYTWIEQAALRFSDHAFTVTQQLKDVFVARGADGSKIDVILNGPDPDHLPGRGLTSTREDGAFVLVCHGTIEDRYGHGTLVDAVNLARGDIPGLRLDITGSGSGVDDLLRRIEILGLTEHVRFHGHVSFEDLGAILRKGDIGVVPMRSSPYSNLVHTNKMFEYILLDMPVVATRLTSVAAYFDDDSVAFVPPDDAEAMAAAIADLYRDPERGRKLAARASQLYEEYGWDRQAELYVQAYDRLVGRQRVKDGS